MSTRWQDTSAPRGDDYDARWRALAAGGHGIHGEADLVETLLAETSRQPSTPNSTWYCWLAT
jgi:hypothetical protein